MAQRDGSLSEALAWIIWDLESEREKSERVIGRATAIHHRH